MSTLEKKKSSQINDPSFYHKKPGKEEKIKFKASKIKAINKNQEIKKKNEAENLFLVKHFDWTPLVKYPSLNYSTTAGAVSCRILKAPP